MEERQPDQLANLEWFLGSMGIQPEGCDFPPNGGQCATTRLLLAETRPALEADIAVPLLRHATETRRREYARASSERKYELQSLSLRSVVATHTGWPGYLQEQGVGPDAAPEALEEGRWLTCVLDAQWQIAQGEFDLCDGHFREAADALGGMVFVDHPGGRRFFLVGGFEGACPTTEFLARHRANVLFCMLTYLGMAPEFVAHCCVFLDDLPASGWIDSSTQILPINYRRLLDPALSPEAADRLMRAADCSMQRHPFATCVASHDVPARARLYGAVHAGNFRPSLSDRAMNLMDRVVERNPTFAAAVARLRAEQGKTRAQLAALVRGRERPDGPHVFDPSPPPTRPPARATTTGAAAAAAGAGPQSTGGRARRSALGARTVAAASRAPGSSSSSSSSSSEPPPPSPADLQSMMMAALLAELQLQEAAKRRQEGQKEEDDEAGSPGRKGKGKGGGGSGGSSTTKKKGPRFPQRCRECGKTAEGAGVEKLRKCGDCKGPAYCSKECQRAAWPYHKAACREAAAASSSGGRGK